jgi:hypothetical protein
VKGHMIAKKTDVPAVAVKQPANIADKLDAEIVSDRRINLTKDRAYKFLELKTFQGERQVNERHVQHLYNAWVSGRFMWEHVIIATCECEGTTYRLNGQHTCWVRVNIENDGVDANVREIVYRVKDQANLRALYSTFDQNKARTQQHIIRALLVGTPTTADIWPSVIGNLASGLRFYLYEKETQDVSTADVAELISGKYSDLFKQVGLFYQNHYDTYFPIRRKAVISAMFATFDAAPQKSQEFWGPVCDALGFIGKGDARWQLRKFLDSHHQSKASKGVRLGRTTGGYVSDEDHYRICIQAWNRWRKGEEVAVLKPTDKRVKAI